MDTRFLIHNSHHINSNNFAKSDPHLKRLKALPLSYQPTLLNELNDKEPGIYTLGGGRQIGKTTLIKMWMDKLLKENKNPKSIYFISGELIETGKELFAIINDIINFFNINNIKETELKYILIDEISYIRNWENAIKYAADSGLFENIIVMLTGSDLAMINDAKKTFPGRRGKASKVDFHHYPLSFREFCNLKNPGLQNKLQKDNLEKTPKDLLNKLSELFNQYIITGGYITAINDIAEQNKILPATLKIYSDWIRGDILKRNKQDHFLKEIVKAIISNYGSQVTYNSLAKNLSIEHHKTVSEYIEILQSMDAVFIQNAILENKLTAAPKKAKKIIFKDPFIFHALNYWLNDSEDPYKNLITPFINNSESCSKLVEAIVISHYQRYFETYYIKAEGEVDIAYINDNKFWPVEIKWTNQLRPKDFKQLLKYNNSILLSKNIASLNEAKVKTIPIFWQLFWMDNNHG